MQGELTAQFIIVAIMTGIMVCILGTVLIIRALRSSSANKQLEEYRALANAQLEATNDIRTELTVLKEKVNSIEKLLKEVE